MSMVPRGANGRNMAAYTGRLMADVYWIGVFLGLGIALGVALAGLLGASRTGLVLALVAAAVLGFIAALFLRDEVASVAGAVGGVVGALAAGEVVRGALRRGGVRLGTAFLVAGAALGLALAALIPIVGYLEAVALPVLALRMRRRRPERYAGLRTLARD